MARRVGERANAAFAALYRVQPSVDYSHRFPVVARPTIIIPRLSLISSAVHFQIIKIDDDKKLLNY